MSPIITPCSSDKMELVEEFRKGDIVIPKGFMTDGASVPRIFRIFYEPFRPKNLTAAVIHDWLYTNAKTYNDYVKADEMLRSLLKESSGRGVAVTFYIAVRFYSFVRFRGWHK